MDENFGNDRYNSMSERLLGWQWAFGRVAPLNSIPSFTDVDLGLSGSRW
ncbi:MAG: hypothetical protein ACLS3M_04380 [Collinsella sp.]